MKNLFMMLAVTVAASFASMGAKAQDCRTVSGDEAVRTPPETAPRASHPEAPPKAGTAAESKAPEVVEEER